MDLHLPKEKDRNFLRFDIFLIRFPPGFSSFDCPLTLLDISKRNLFSLKTLLQYITLPTCIQANQYLKPQRSNYWTRQNMLNLQIIYFTQIRSPVKYFEILFINWGHDFSRTSTHKKTQGQD